MVTLQTKICQIRLKFKKKKKKECMGNYYYKRKNLLTYLINRELENACLNK